MILLIVVALICYTTSLIYCIKMDLSRGDTVAKHEFGIIEWNELRKQYPEMRKTQLRQVDKALFAWLYRNDREWLNQNSA